MILTLSSADNTIHIELSTEQFKRLRQPDVEKEEVETIARLVQVNPEYLYHYVDDLKRSVREMEELDGSCDYSDHL